MKRTRREPRELRDAAYALVADRPKARHRRGARMGARRVPAGLGGLRQLPDRSSTRPRRSPERASRRRRGSATWSRSSAAPSGPTTSSSSQGHIDSRVTDIMNATSDAPGANDDGSGTAAVMEAARVLSKHKFPGTIVYAALSGEEQGLYGGKVLANYAKAQGWNVVTDPQQRHHRQQLLVRRRVRFDACARAVRRAAVAGTGGACRRRPTASAARMTRRRATSRASSTASPTGCNIGLDVRQIWRTDRFGRGGDHIPFLELGYPAARHQRRGRELRLAAPGPADRERQAATATPSTTSTFAYLAKMTKLNVAALAAIASAPPPPEPKVEGAVSTDTTLTWPGVS